MSQGAKTVLLGEFGRAHGLAGEVRLKSYTADPLAIATYGPLVGTDGRRVVLASVRPAAGDQPDMLVARVEGVSNREAAERLNRLGLGIGRDRLGDTDDDEFFLVDLVGLAVEDRDGAAFGRVVAVPDYGSGEMLEIAPPGPGRRTLLLPFTKAFVPEVDIMGGRVVIAPPTGWDDAEGAGASGRTLDDHPA